jgi:hypothetical protein
MTRVASENVLGCRLALFTLAGFSVDKNCPGWGVCFQGSTAGQSTGTHQALATSNHAFCNMSETVGSPVPYEPDGKCDRVACCLRHVTIKFTGWPNDQQVLKKNIDHFLQLSKNLAIVAIANFLTIFRNVLLVQVNKQLTSRFRNVLILWL